MRVASGMLTVEGRVLLHPALMVKEKANGQASHIDLVSRHTWVPSSTADEYVRARTKADKGRQMLGT